MKIKILEQELISLLKENILFALVLILFLNIGKTYAFAQNKNYKISKIIIDQTYPSNPQAYEGLNAAFYGGHKAFNNFFAKNIRYKKGMLNGNVQVNFEINKDGSLSNIHIVKGLSKLNDDEVLRILRLSPKWHPAILYGKPTQQSQTLPVSFQKK